MLPPNGYVIVKLIKDILHVVNTTSFTDERMRISARALKQSSKAWSDIKQTFVNIVRSQNSRALYTEVERCVECFTP